MIYSAPPPLAPPVPPPFLSKTIRQKVTAQVELPLLNWTPIYSVSRTIFEVSGKVKNNAFSSSLLISFFLERLVC